jgi:hypothetical protein
MTWFQTRATFGGCYQGQTFKGQPTGIGIYINRDIIIGYKDKDQNFQGP